MTKLKLKNTFTIDNLIWFLTVLQLVDFMLGTHTLFSFVILGINFFLMLSRGFRFTKHFPWSLVIYSIFALFCLLSSFWAISPAEAKRVSFSMMKMIVITVVYYYYYAEGKKTIQLLSALMWCGFLVVIITICYYGPVNIIFMIRNNIRMDNSLINANDFGMSVAMSMAIAVYFFQKDEISLSTVMCIPAIPALAVSGSRKAILLFGLVVLLYLFNKQYFSRNRVRKILTMLPKIAALIMLVMGVLQLPVFITVKERLAVLLQLILGNATLPKSETVRLDLIKYGLGIFKENWLAGIGIDNVKLLNPYIKNGYLHCNYVELLSDVGIVGTLLYYSVYIYLLWTFFRIKRHTDMGCFIIAILLCRLILDFGYVSYYSRETFFYVILFELNVYDRYESTKKN